MILISLKMKKYFVTIAQISETVIWYSNKRSGEFKFTNGFNSTTFEKRVFDFENERESRIVWNKICCTEIFYFIISKISKRISQLKRRQRRKSKPYHSKWINGSIMLLNKKLD